jgi:hypothetical protein
MRTITKGLVAGAIGLAVLVPGGMALADDGDPAPGEPVCTTEERQERWETRDRLRTEILAQLEAEGVTDPDQVREQLRTRLHEAMEAQYGEMPGPQAGMGPEAGMGPHAGDGRGPGDGRGSRHGSGMS